jgi:hypothetical protein
MVWIIEAVRYSSIDGLWRSGMMIIGELIFQWLQVE